MRNADVIQENVFVIEVGRQPERYTFVFICVHPW